MPYRVSWLVEERVVLQEFWGHLNAAELSGAVQEFAALMDAGTPPIHLISDAHAVESYPKSIGTYMKSFNYRPDPQRIGWLVVILPDSPVARFIGNTVPQVGIVGMRFRIVANYDEVVTFLAHQDETLTLPESIPSPY